MVDPRIAVCPICGSKTYLRIENGSYLLSYPIRVSCLKCHSLIKGIYRMSASNGAGKLYLYNAKIEECDTIPINNNTTIFVRNADFVAEISGELPCKKARYYKSFQTKSFSTPFMDAAKQVDVENMINTLKRFVQNIREWESYRSISFQLLSEGSMDYLPTALHNKMGDYDYPCDNYLKSFHCLQAVVLEQTRILFNDCRQEDYIKNLINQISVIDETKLHSFVIKIGGVDSIISSFQKNMEVFSSFVDIYPHVLPAVTYTQYKNKEDSDIGISTCSFTDIKTFYQDAYEALLSLLHIPVCMDNILFRNDYDVFGKTYISLFKKSRYKNLNDDLDKYLALDNGMKFEKIDPNETLQKALNFPAKRLLRNAIGHNNIKYNGASQMITVYGMKNTGEIKLSLSLLDMAIQCIGLVKSSVIMSEILLFIMRHELINEGVRSIIPMQFYNNNEPNEKCPCGSNKKYKKCCKIDVERIKHNKNGCT